MTPYRAHIWHVPWLLAILWAHRTGHWWSDLWIMARATFHGWIRAVSDDRGLVGFSLRKGGDLHALYVHPRAQGRGLGQLLLEDAKAQAQGLNLWVAQDNAGGRRFYNRHGFAEKRRSDGVENEEGRPEILMVWPPERRVEP